MAPKVKNIFKSLAFFCSFSILLALAPPSITNMDVKAKIQELLKIHVIHHDLSVELVAKSLLRFVDELDPLKTYLLDSEIAPLIHLDELQSKKVQTEMKEGNYAHYKLIYNLMLTAIERRNELEKKLSCEPLAPEKASVEVSTFCKTEQELYERLSTIRKLQLHSAKLIEEKKPAQILKLHEKIRLGLEQDIAHQDELFRDRQLHAYILKAFASSLDAHTAYFTPVEANDFLIQVQQRLYGIGVLLKDDLDGLRITKIIDGGPAHKTKKLELEDKIIAVNDEPIIGLSIRDAVEKIRGPQGTNVFLTILRKDSKVQIEIYRDEIIFEENRFNSKLIEKEDGSILHFHLYSFYEDRNNSSEKDLLHALKEAEAKGPIKGVILDLRENTGGLMSQAVYVAGLFLQRGVVVSIKDAIQGVHHLRNLRHTPLFKGPLIVLIDRLSASSSEIVAQSLKEYGRALIVGDPESYGKGSYQVFSLDPNRPINQKGETKVTRGLYYTVSGKSPQKMGVSSDIIVKGPFGDSEIGEKFHPNALCPDEIAPNFIDSLTDLTPLLRFKVRRNAPQEQFNIDPLLIQALQKQSEARLKGNSRYNELQLQKEISSSTKELETLVFEETLNIIDDFAKHPASQPFISSK